MLANADIDLDDYDDDFTSGGALMQPATKVSGDNF